MPFSFPSSPTNGQQSTQNGRVFQWTGTAWELVATPSGFDGAAITTGTVAAERLGTHATTHNPGGADPVTLVEVYEFTRSSKPAAATGSNGSYSFTIPAAAKVVEFFAVSGGGGGGSGRRGAAGTARFGGGGGGSGGVMLVTRSVSELSTRTLGVSVGAGGAGGAAVTANDTNGNSGSNGGDSLITFGSTSIGCTRGLGGSGGTAAAGTGATSQGNAQFAGGAGGASSATATPSTTNSSNGNTASGGSGGGGISTLDAPQNGGIARAQGWLVASIANATGGTAPGGAGQNPADVYTQVVGAQPGGSGGGGAAGNASTAGGSGGNGASYGGAGGGGGASFNGFNSGAGGNGGDGYVRITVWY